MIPVNKTLPYNTIISVSGPSGSGKSSFVKNLIEAYPKHLTSWKQVTTRKKRDNLDDYIFLTKNHYDKIIETLTCRTSFNGNHYGTFIEEFTSTDNAVLIIANSEGLKDLIDDIDRHNYKLYNNTIVSDSTFDIKNAIQLYKIYIGYDINQSSITERQREERGIETLQKEVDDLSKFDYNLILTTTGQQWPEIFEIFDEYLYPALYFDFQSIKYEIREICTNLLELVNNSNDYNELELLRNNLNHISNYDINLKEEFTNAKLALDNELYLIQQSNIDLIDEILENKTEDNSFIDGSEYSSDFLNDQTPENRVKLQEYLEKEKDKLINVVKEDQEEIEEKFELVSDEEEIKDQEEIYEKVKTQFEVYESCQLSDWLKTQIIGTDMFEDTYKFQLYFRQYISANGGDPSLQLNISKTVGKDDKDGDISYITIIGSDKSVYDLIFNHRIQQITKELHHL
jgi:energy-coupling factor transporter ATP-binding protein EcfA2